MIDSGWYEKCLEEICTVKGGKRLPAGHLLQDEATDHPYIKSRDIRGGKVSTADLQYLNSNTFDKIKRYIVNTGDVCITIVANIGDVGVVPKALNGANLTENAVKLTKLSREVDSAFLGTLLSHPQYKAYMEQLSAGAAQAKLGIYKIRRIKVRLPPFPTQRKIAAILTAYDDLIEVNKRRIALLEKMAEELYREWFVRLRFPGYQDTRFVKGVPEGWDVVELRDICSEASKSTKAGQHLSTRLYLPLDSLATKKMLPTDHYDYTAAQSSLALFERGDILFGAMRPYQHKVVFAPFKGVTRTTMFVIRPSDSYLRAYTYLNLFQNSSIEYATLICNGVDRPYVVWKRGMERMKVFLPKKEALVEFEKIVGPILEKIHEFYFIQRKLAETRDLLLPRLISGKLSVEDLDIQFPPSMQEGTAEHESQPEARHA